MNSNNPLDFDLDAATYVSMFDAPEIVEDLDHHAYRLENITPPPVPMPAQPVQQQQQQRPVQPPVPQNQRQRPVHPVHPQAVSQQQQQRPVPPQSVSQAPQQPVQTVQVQSKPSGGKSSGKQPKNGQSVEKKGAKIVGQPAGQGTGVVGEKLGAKAGGGIESSGEGTSKQALSTGKKRSADEKSSKLVFAQEEGKSYPEALMSIFGDATVVKKYKICGKLGPVLTKWEASFEPEDPAMINNRIIASGNGISIDINLQKNMFSVRAD